MHSLQPMHGRISWTRPCAVFVMISGSVMIASADEVGLSLGDDFFGCVRVGDPSGVDDGQGDGSGHLGG